MNNLPNVSFAGTDLRRHLTLGANYLYRGSDGLTVFMMVHPTKAAGFGIFDFGARSGAGYGFSMNSSVGNFYTASNFGGVGIAYELPEPNSNWQIVVAQVRLAGDQQARINGERTTYTKNPNLTKLGADEIQECDTRGGTGGTSGQFCDGVGYGPFTIGGQSKTFSESFWSGGLAELVFFDRALSLTEIQEVECYLIQKFAIGLPGC